MGTLGDKLRLCRTVLATSETSEACGSCGGSDLSLRTASGVRLSPIGPDGVLTVYEAVIVCNECGAVCNASRIWRLPEPTNVRGGT